MTSAQKIAANRANSRKSTGPKTAKGKARSARNARRHGLSLSVLASPQLSKEVEALAWELASGCTSEDVIGAARLAAEAQIEVARVRRFKLDFFEQHKLGAPVFQPDASDESTETQSSLLPAFENLIRDERKCRKMEPSVSQYALKQLVKIRRYELRARSKRKFAFRTLGIALRAERRRRACEDR